MKMSRRRVTFQFSIFNKALKAHNLIIKIKKMVDFVQSNDSLQSASNDVLSLLSNDYLNSLSPTLFTQLFFDIQDRFLAVKKLNNRFTLLNLLRNSFEIESINSGNNSIKKLSVCRVSDSLELCSQPPGYVGMNYFQHRYQSNFVRVYW